MTNTFYLSKQIALALFVILASSVIAIEAIDQSRVREEYVQERSVYLDKFIQTQGMRLKQQIEVLRRDVLFLSNTPPVAGIIRAKLNHGMDPRDGNSQAKWASRLASIFSAFSLGHSGHLRISYISMADGGDEIVAVSSRDGQVVSVIHGGKPAADVSEDIGNALKLTDGEVYLSKFEYLQEWAGARRFPVLRAVTPIYAPSGKAFGVLMVEVDATVLLKSFSDGLSADIEAYIANRAGQYLVVPDSSRNLDVQDYGNIAADFPVLERLLRLHEGGTLPAQGTLQTKDGQLLSASRLYFDSADPSRFLALIYRTRDVMSGQKMFALPTGNIALALSWMLLIGVLVYFWLRRKFIPLEQLAQAADRIAAGEREIFLPEKASGEIGRLLRAVDIMLKQLLRRERDAKQVNAELEQQVKQRTGDLEFSTKLLKDAVEQGKSRQQELQLQLRRNQVLMTTSMDGIHVMDMQGNLIEANDAFCRMLGYSRDEVVKLNVADLDVQWSAEKLRERFNSLIGKTELFETVHCRKDGSLIDVEISAAGVELDGKGFLFASSRDITERKRAEGVMKQHERVIQTAIDGYWMTDLSGILLEVNQAYADISGYSIEELVGMHISQLEANERPEEVKAHMEKIIAHGLDRFETRHRRKDGHIVDIEVSANYMAETEHVFVFCHDISQRKQDEEMRQIAAVAFETQDAIVITDAEVNIIRVNRSFEHITGYRAAEVIGRNPRIMSSGRHDREFYREMWQCLKIDGAWAGEIWDKRKSGQVYPRWMTITAIKNASGEVTNYVGVFADITERKQVEEDIRHLAFYDALTQLPNRRLLNERLRAAVVAAERRRNYGAVLFLDMDRFKTLNDTLGHDYGDLMLIEVARRIKSCVREMDTVARLGGDEFVVVLDDVSAGEGEVMEKVEVVAEKIRESLACPYQLKDHEYQSSPSIGIALFNGSGETPEILLRNADAAMYQAKRSGRNALRFYEPLMQAENDSDNALKADLNHVVVRGELRLVYQVQVDRDLHPTGAEALLRWDSPQHGWLMPDRFLFLAEQSKRIIEIDLWVLNQACEQLARWATQEKTRNLTLAINVSSLLFVRHDYVAQVAAALNAHGVNPQLLVLEVMEGSLIDDMSGSAKRMEELKTLGVTLSMDDFGAGYTSLSCLKQLPLDQIKICRQFVQNIEEAGNDALLIQAIIDLTSKFNWNVLAEGVETEAQFAFLKQQQCMVYQGFLFGKGIPLDEFESSLQ